MQFNQDMGYGRGMIDTAPFTTGKVFYVGTAAAVALNLGFQDIITSDEQGIPRLYNTAALALAQTVAGRGDVIVLLPSYGALTAAELLLAETNSVAIRLAGSRDEDGFFANRLTAALPASATGSIFTVTGRVKLLSIIGEVTTVIQTQACNLKITNTPTVGSAVDLCANANVSGLTVGTQLNITGTLATALQTNNGALLYQASPIILKAGTIDLITSATNTGSVKWNVKFQPIDQGAYISAL